MATKKELNAAYRARMVSYLRAQASHYEVDERAGAALASLAYEDDLGGDLPGYAFLQFHETASDYQAAALYHTASRTLVIANRGTEGLMKLKDWKANIRQAGGNPNGQMSDAVAFAFEMIDAHRGKGVNMVVCVGHSLGAGLAEAQVALTPGLLQLRGRPGVNVEGIGTGSAGFVEAVEKLADLLGIDPAPYRDVKMSHYVRAEDPIRDARLKSFTTPFAPPSIYQPIIDTQSGGGRPPHPRIIGCDPLINHSSALYFALFDALFEEPRSKKRQLFSYRDGSFENRLEPMEELGPYQGIHKSWRRPADGAKLCWPEA